MVRLSGFACGACVVTLCTLAADLDIDLSAQLGPMEHCAAGVLHSLTSEAPDAAYVDPLSLRLYRGNADEIVENARRLSAIGIRQTQVVVSDSYGYGAPWPGDDGSFEAWDRVVDEVVAKVAGVEHIAFDLWNEPNGGPAPQMKGFWKRSKEQFFDTWKHGFLRLRASLPNATIVGPSSNSIAGGLIFGTSGQEWMHDFLSFAHENEVMPDIVSWHELLPSAVEPRHGYILVEEVQQLRSWMASSGIPSRPISINEYTPEDANTKPGTTAGFIASLERSGVQSAAHSCWNDDTSCGSEFASNCFSGTLDGLLACPSRKPRAAWWVYATYGNMTGTKVSVERNTKNADAVAVRGPSQIRVLVGTYPKFHKKISLSVKHLPKELQSSPSVTVRRFSGTDWSELSQPVIVLPEDVTVVDDTLEFSLDASPEDAFDVAIAESSIVL